MNTPSLSTFAINRLAVEALVDSRTIRRYLAGHPVAPMPRIRIEATLREQGLACLIQSDNATPKLT